MHGSMGGGRKPDQSGSLSRAVQAPLAYPTNLRGRRIARPRSSPGSGLLPRRGRALPMLSDSSSATAGGAAAALVLAASASHVASTGRVELGGRAVGVALRAIRALRDSHHQVTHARAVTDAGLGVRLVTRCCSAPKAVTPREVLHRAKRGSLSESAAWAPNRHSRVGAVSGLFPRSRGVRGPRSE